MALTDKLVSIADSIRAKTGGTEPLTLDEMAAAIEGIETGGGANLSEIESQLSNGFTDYSSYFSGGGRGKLTKVPTEILQHTGNGTAFKRMFYACYALQTIPLFDTSAGEVFSNMHEDCSSLVNVPSYDLSSAKVVNHMFAGCKNLETVLEVNAPSATNFASMFHTCSKLQSAYLLDTSAGEEFRYMFYRCSALKTVDGLDVSNATDVSNLFSQTYALENLRMSGVIKTSGLSLSDCTKLTHDSLMSVINALYDWAAEGSTSTYTQALGGANLAKLTDEEKAIATGKGWTLA